MSYEQLDIIADAYIPLLLMLSIGLISATYLTNRKNPQDNIASLKRFHLQHNPILALLCSTIWVYGWMLIDKAFKLWPTLHLDYSTHTAAALMLAVFLSRIGLLPGVKALKVTVFAILAISVIAYGGLMWFQQYHTVTDMLSTALVILPVAIGLNLPALVSSSHQTSSKGFDTTCSDIK